ncbi:MAG: hypothetical protein M3Y08_14090 [Fibrobacterota bacterium]|nr:hypothetical protein [Fibrobacterota bacterium]
MKHFTIAAAVFLAFSMAFTGCRKEGVAEKAGESLDGSRDNPISDAVNPDGLGEKAGKKIDKIVD